MVNNIFKIKLYLSVYKLALTLFNVNTKNVEKKKINKKILKWKNGKENFNSELHKNLLLQGRRSIANL